MVAKLSKDDIIGTGIIERKVTSTIVQDRDLFRELFEKYSASQFYMDMMWVIVVAGSEGAPVSDFVKLLNIASKYVDYEDSKGGQDD